MVVDSDIRPPPIIHHGPQNQTLPISSMAVLQCAVAGDPAPTVRWYKNARLLTLAEHRFVLRDSGSLQIGGQWTGNYRNGVVVSVITAHCCDSLSLGAFSLLVRPHKRYISGP